jgi:hypothetical protein
MVGSPNSEARSSYKSRDRDSGHKVHGAFLCYVDGSALYSNTCAFSRPSRPSKPAPGSEYSFIENISVAGSNTRVSGVENDHPGSGFGA